jgi:PIN domain nuclease of toxin-antitoxin system
MLLPSKLSVAAREAIEDVRNDRFVSAATFYEIGYKIKVGKLALPPQRDLKLATKLLQANTLAISVHHMTRAAALPVDNRDPFDRILAAQALEEGLFLVTSDSNMQTLGAPLIW